MTQPSFNLRESRFDRIEVTGFVNGSTDVARQDLKLEFSVSFPGTKEEIGSDSFDIRLKIKVTRVEGDSEDVILSARVRGIYAFEHGVEPYLVEDQLERIFAVGILYAGVRPLLDSILGMSGFPGLTMPASLPHPVDKSSVAPTDGVQSEPEDTD